MIDNRILFTNSFLFLSYINTNFPTHPWTNNHSTDMSVAMAMETMTVGKVETDYNMPVGDYKVKYEGMDLIEQMNDNNVDTTQELELMTSGSGSCAATSTADFVQVSLKMSVSAKPTEEDKDQLRVTMQTYLEDALSIETIIFTDFEVTYEARRLTP